MRVLLRTTFLSFNESHSNVYFSDKFADDICNCGYHLLLSSLLSALFNVGRCYWRKSKTVLVLFHFLILKAVNPFSRCVCEFVRSLVFLSRPFPLLRWWLFPSWKHSPLVLESYSLEEKGASWVLFSLFNFLKVTNLSFKKDQNM